MGRVREGGRDSRSGLIWFIWFVLFIWLVWFNQTNQTDQKTRETSRFSRVPRHGLWRLTYDVRRNRLTANDPFLSL